MKLKKKITLKVRTVDMLDDGHYLVLRTPVLPVNVFIMVPDVFNMSSYHFSLAPLKGLKNSQDRHVRIAKDRQLSIFKMGERASI
jgi:hypothetical protein